MEIAEWCEVAWLQLGDQHLRAGLHTLELRLAKTKDDKGETQRILFACDALCLSAGPFSPNSRFTPDEDGRDDRDRQAAETIFKLTEPAAPVNQTKKRSILAAVLRNLKAPFAGGRTVIAGGNLTCAPVDIHTKATSYKDQRGWFGDAGRTFQAFPAGEHVLAGVKYNIYEMPTSPVPQVLMLGGDDVPGNPPTEITGIPVKRKADALFFLHTARVDRRLDDRARSAGEQLEMFRYVVHYADGSELEVPVVSEQHIDEYRQPHPTALPGAQLAWTRPYPDSDISAAAYAMQWNNPRPDVEIVSLDMVYGPDRCGVPCLIALTAVTAP